MLIAAAIDPWRYNLHPEVWLIVAAAAAGYWYAVARIGPRVLAPGTAAVSVRQIAWFASGLATIWVAGGWPLHDIAENYLYSAHMLEHLLISLVAPPLLLLGIPDWLTRFVLRPRVASGAVRVLCRPLVAGVAFNVVIALSHAPFYVNFTLYHDFWHFWAHMLLFVVSMLMWFPVVNHLREYPTLNPPLKMAYLFLQSVIPNVPVAFLTLSTGVVYTFYAHVPRPFPISVLTDQQLAGAIMKIGGTTLLWSIILVVFFKWYGDQVLVDRAERSETQPARLQGEPEGIGPTAGPGPGPGPGPEDAAMPELLTWEHVEAELAKSQPAKPGIPRAQAP